jgi:hypothetical protein
VAKGISLHIGLNSVDPKHYAGWSGDLVACEADAGDMERIAARAGYATKTLLTKQGSRAAVRAGIEEAAKRLEKGDIFLITYSGHGGQLPDVNDDEPDGNDETWCLYDGEIVDDELYQLYARFVEGVRVFVLSDSCHSGSVIKQYRDIASRSGTEVLNSRDGAIDAVRPRTMPPDVALRVYRQNREEYDSYLKQFPSEKSSKADLRARVRLISGCQDNQTSLDGTFNGLFTGTLLKVWKEGAFAGDYSDFHRAILARMPATQSPEHMVIGPANTAYDAQTPFTI